MSDPLGRIGKDPESSRHAGRERQLEWRKFTDFLISRYTGNEEDQSCGFGW